MLVQSNMDQYCDKGNKTINPKSTNKHLQSLTHNEYEKGVRKNHTIKNPNLFDINFIFNKVMEIHEKKFDLYLVKYDFILVFDSEVYLHIKSEFQYNTSIFYRKRFLLNWVEIFSERRHQFSHIYELNITSSSNKRYMTCECYIKKPMQMVDLILKLTLFRNPHVIKSLDRRMDQLFTRNYSNISYI